MSKTHTLKCAAYNLGLLLRKVWGYRKPRNMEAGSAALFAAFLALLAVVAEIAGWKTTSMADLWQDGPGLLLVTVIAAISIRFSFHFWKNRHFLTGC